MKKKFIAGILTAALALGTLTACGDSGAAANAESTENGAEEAAPSDVVQAETKGTITVAASATPHAEILEQAKQILAEQGWDLQVTVFNDYVQPNMVVESGEFDANYFQHIPYLDSFNEEQGTHLVNAGGIHYEPFGIYAGTESDLTNVPEGADVAVPNDTTNEARALLLLQDNGLLKLKEGAGINATANDIEEKHCNIVEMEAANLPRSLPDLDIAVVNGNYAIDGQVIDRLIESESAQSEAAQTFANIVAVREGDDRPELKKLLERGKEQP